MIPHSIHVRGALSDWRQKLRSSTSDNVWINRDGADLVELPSGTYAGRIVMYGGWHSSAQATWGGTTTTNEINASDNRGATWTQLSGHVASPPTSGAGAKQLPGHTLGVCLHTVSGVDYVYVVGGDPAAPNGHVWRYPVAQGGFAGGERMTTTGPTSDNTVLHKTISFGGYLWCMGGQTDLASTATAHSKVYRSVDGASWTARTDAPWAGRSAIGLTVHRDELIVAAGSKYHTVDATRVHYNDVWKMSAAESWTQVLADGHVQFAKRHYHNLVSAGGRLWLALGWNSTAPADEIGSGSTGNLHSIFWSPTGALWTRFSNAQWGGSHADGMCATRDGRIIRAAGNKFDTATYEISR